MEKAEALEQLKSLHDQIRRTEIRQEDLPDQMPFHVHPQSVNYEKDLTRLQGEYNRLAASLQREGVLTEMELAAEELPLQMEKNK